MEEETEKKERQPLKATQEKKSESAKQVQGANTQQMKGEKETTPASSLSSSLETGSCKCFLVVGMMKTGTNAVVEALTANRCGPQRLFEVCQEEWRQGSKNASGLIRLGSDRVIWKHQPGVLDWQLPAHVIPVVCIREPLSWLASLRRTRNYGEYQYQSPPSAHPVLRRRNWWILSPLTVFDPQSQVATKYESVWQYALRELHLVAEGRKLGSKCSIVDCHEFASSAASVLQRLVIEGGLRCPAGGFSISGRHAKTKEVIDPISYMEQELQEMSLRNYEIEALFENATRGWQALYKEFGWSWPAGASQVQ